MIVNRKDLESGIDEIRDWLKHQPDGHHLRSLKEQNLQYYTQKLVEMEEIGDRYIKI